MNQQILELSEKCTVCKELLEDCICGIDINDVDDELEELV